MAALRRVNATLGTLIWSRWPIPNFSHLLAERWGVTRAYDKIDLGQVAPAAWGVSDIMDGVDARRIETFFETYSGTLGHETIVYN